MRLTWVLLVCCDALTIRVVTPVPSKNLCVIVAEFGRCTALSNVESVIIHTANVGDGGVNVTADVVRNDGKTVVSSGYGHGLLRACEVCAANVFLTALH